MMEEELYLTFRGVRGSRCSASDRTLRYGGNTTCLETRLAGDSRLIIDCGTGLLSLQRELLKEVEGAGPGPSGSTEGGSQDETDSPRGAEAAGRNLKLEVLLTHYHQDHLEGLPLFDPLYDRDCHFTFYGYPWEGRGVRDVLEGAIRPPLFPRSLKDTESAKTFVDLSEKPFEIAGITITTARTRHPQGSTAYRLQRGGRSIVFATDTEYGEPKCDEALQELARGAEVLIHDAHFTPDEYERHRGQGHSTWRHAVEVARNAGVERLVLFHHDPDRSDDELDEIVGAALKEFPGVEAAREGTSLLMCSERPGL